MRRRRAGCMITRRIRPPAAPRRATDFPKVADLTAVTLSDVHKHYGSETTVAMDVAIADGEMFTVLGPAGCGKSTVLRLIAGFVTPTAGQILFGERDVTRWAPHRREVGMVFPEGALFGQLTVASNIEYGLRARHIRRKERRQRVGRVLSQVGLGDFGARRVGQLSVEQRGRAALARALVISPQVLLLDEPLTGLDAHRREHTRIEIRRIQAGAGITTVYATQDRTEALAMSDRIAVLSEGRVHQIGTPHQVYYQPATPFVAQFLAHSTIVPVRVAAIEPDRIRVFLPGGTTIMAPHPHFEPEIGQDIAVALRPDALGFTTGDDALATGKVTETEFAGATTSYTVVSKHFTVRVNSATTEGPAVGDTVSVGLISGQPWLVEP